jgi:ribosomal-protein-alanine N-acetyltransferase
MLPGFSPFPELSTERLRLRQLTLGDEKEIFLLRSDAEVNRYLDRPRAETIEDAQQFIQTIRSGVQEDKWVYWAICLRTDAALIGSIGLWNISREHSKAEIGYELLPAWQGKGIMSEVLPSVLDFGFSRMKLRTIDAVLDPANTRSLKLLHTHGFTKLDSSEVAGTVTYSLEA